LADPYLLGALALGLSLRIHHDPVDTEPFLLIDVSGEPSPVRAK